MHKNHCTDSRHTPQTQRSKVLLAASWTTQIRNQCWAGAYWTASTTSKNTSFPRQSCNNAFRSLVAEWSQQEALTSGCFQKSSEHMLTHKNIHIVMHYDAKLAWCWQGLPCFEIQNPGWKTLSGTHWYTYTAVKRDVASLPMASYKGACKFHSWYWCDRSRQVCERHGVVSHSLTTLQEVLHSWSAPLMLRPQINLRGISYCTDTPWCSVV